MQQHETLVAQLLLACGTACAPKASWCRLGWIEVYSNGLGWRDAYCGFSWHASLLFIVVFHGLPTGGLPTTNLAVVKISAGEGNPFRDLVVVIFGVWLPSGWLSWLCCCFFHTAFASDGIDAQHSASRTAYHASDHRAECRRYHIKAQAHCAALAAWLCSAQFGSAWLGLAWLVLVQCGHRAAR